MTRTKDEDRIYRASLRARQRAPVEAPVSRIIKTPEQAVAQVRRLRPTVAGEAHYFDGWYEEMTPGQREYVYARLASHATPRR